MTADKIDYKKDEMFCVADFWAIETHACAQAR